MKLLLTLAALLLLVTAKAQDKIDIHGVVKAAGSPLQAASVSLLRQADSALVKIAVTDKEGHYEFAAVAAGKYLLMATSVGFGTVYQQATAGQQPEIVLAPVATAMSGVTVQARKPLVEAKVDRMVVNVDASPSSAGASALEVLEKSPGIAVDRDGNISLKGKAGVMVMMDGKQTYLSGQELANLLRSLPASQLEQVEIMTQPSAKYDAAGNAGIINLRTKKNRQTGMNGNISLGYIQGFFPKSPNTFGFNYRKGKFNVYTNGGYTYWQDFGTQAFYRRYPNGATPYIFEQQSSYNYTSNNINARVGVDYSLNSKTTLGLSINARRNDEKSRNQGFGNLYTLGSNTIDSSIDANSRQRTNWSNVSTNINFRRTLSASGRELNADLDYISYKSEIDLFTNNRSLYPMAEPEVYLLRAMLPSNINIYSGKLDYVHPLNKTAKFETGIKSSLVRTDNNAPYETYNDAMGKWVDDVRKDHFAYDEQISAGYVNFNTQLKKWGFQAGLRGEYTQSKGTQVLIDKSIRRSYFQLFPTAFVSYALSDKHQFGLNYGRRIERPNYADMNPFQRFLDLYTFNQGNPYLTPQFTHNVELSHNWKGKLNTTFNYTRTTDILNDIVKQNNETKVIYQTKENVATLRNIGAAISYNASVNKWWTTSLYSNVYHNKYMGLVNNRLLQATITAFSFNMNQVFRFAKTWTAEAGGFYQSRRFATSMFQIDPMYQATFGASKQILKTKGTIKLSVIDPFNWQRAKVFIRHDNINMDVFNRWDNRRVGITFTYRFSKGENVQQNRRSGGAQEEAKRIGG